MTVQDAMKILNAEIIMDKFQDNEIKGAYTSDLLSDVMAHAKEGCALITIQAHKNTVAVATLVNASAIIICNFRPIPNDMISAAEEEGIALLRTRENQFTVSGKLYGELCRQ